MKPRILSNRFLLRTIIATCIVAAGALLIDLWFDAFDKFFLTKLLSTCAIVAVLAGILKAAVADMDDEDKGMLG